MPSGAITAPVPLRARPSSSTWSPSLTLPMRWPSKSNPACRSMRRRAEPGTSDTWRRRDGRIKSLFGAGSRLKSSTRLEFNSMKRVLFVDDEAKILEGLERMLRPMRKEWQMVFASSGAEALRLMEASPFDVIVTDMRMPEMDGAQLLEQVQQRFPGVVRLVLSGYFELEMAVRAVPVAHQYLAKPCDPEKLRLAIEHACGFTAILTDEAARQVVGAVGALPSMPRTCAA